MFSERDCGLLEQGREAAAVFERLGRRHAWLERSFVPFDACVGWMAHMAVQTEVRARLYD